MVCLCALGLILAWSNVSDAKNDRSEEIKPQNTGNPVLEGERDTLMVFVAQIDGQWDLFSWDPFGNEKARQLTSTSTDERWPSLSADRNIILYSDTGGLLHGMKIKEDSKWIITQEGERSIFIFPKLSPDGKRILAAAREAPGKLGARLAIRHLDDAAKTDSSYRYGDPWIRKRHSKKPTWLLKMEASQYCPSWGPEEKKIVFCNIHSRVVAGRIITEIWEARVDRADARQLTLLDAFSKNPSWSPDGSRVVFVSNKYGHFNIFEVDVHTREIKRLTKENASENNPVYSPSGRYVAYVSTKTGSSAIWILDKQTSRKFQAKPFEKDNVPCKDPDWK
jgi:TolB protein